MTTTAEVIACPVCRDNGPDRPTCVHCGWTLAAGPWLGAATEANRQAFAEQLAAERRRFDLAVAARAAGYPDRGDADTFARLARLVRGGQASAAELANARDGAPHVPGASIADVVRPALGWLAAEPDGTGARELTIVELRADCVALVRLRANETGIPTPTGPVAVLAWPDLLPSLPHAADEGLFALAGGIIAADEVDALRQVIERGSGDVVPGLLVLQRLAGWPIPDRLVEGFVGAVHPVRADEPRLDADWTEAVRALAPLRHDYRLVLIATDDQGRTSPVTHPLFASGSTAASSSDATVAVIAPDSDGQPVLLSVVTGPPGAPLRSCVSVAVFRCVLAPGARHELRFRLDGPGRLRLIHPDAVGPNRESRSAWPSVLDAVPESYQPGTGELDVVFAIELGGTVEEIARRRDFVADVIAVIERRNPYVSGVRIGVIGYHDHLPRRTGPLNRSGFGSTAEGREYLAELSSSPMIEPFAAPIEDALRAVRGWRPAPVGRRLIVLGARPPHPSRDASVQRCPNGLDWRAELVRLQEADVHFVAVWDRPARLDRSTSESRRAAKEWRQLSRRPRQTVLLSAITPESAAEHAGLLTAIDRPATLLFPLAVGDITQEDHE